MELVAKLKSRLGEFWFYSLMLFVALRLADALNIFVGVWLVPKYVSHSELGAVMPLATFATLLSVPAGVFAVAFMKEINALATSGEYGKIKTLMRGVFIGAAALMLAAIFICRLIMPYFLERMRISEGSLGLLILVSSFAGSVAPVYTNALQALKKFRAISIINFFGAPVRFFSMIVAMPYRALSGYFVGQASTPIFHIISSVFFLRRELSVKSDPYWTRQVVGRFLFLFVGIMMVYGTSTFCATVEQLIIRQRLPEVDSAAYYMLTRFADMSGFLSAALSITLFPYAGELASKGRSAVSLVLKCSLSMVVFGAALSMAFVWKGEWLLSILPSGELYAPFAKYIPWLIAINIMGAIVGFFTTAEISAGRFAFLRWWIPLHLIYVALMMIVTGHGYLNAILPGDIVDFIASFNITSIEIMIIWIGIATAIRLLFSVFALATDRRFSRTDPEAAVAEGV